jgi:hypothetical protein
VSDSIVKQITGLHRLTGAQLKERWRELYGTESPGYNRTFLIKRLAHRIQELVHGGLPEAARGRMNEALVEAGFDELGGEPGRWKESRHRPDTPVAGTRLVRERNGRRCEVTVVSGGFVFEGRRPPEKRYRLSIMVILSAALGRHESWRLRGPDCACESLPSPPLTG